MSINIVLVTIGIVLIVVGLAKIGTGRTGNFSLRNIGINFGSTNNQVNTVGNVAPAEHKSSKKDWVGAATAIVGLLTAIIGLFAG
jgi:hypothetical protein